jgi:16S rRNA processing protein RimM
MKAELFPIGSVVGPHGVRGTVRVKSYVEPAVFFEPGSRLSIRCPAGEEKTYTVRGFNAHSKGVLLSLDSVDDLSGAERLRGCEILAEKSRLPELEEDTYYWMDLIGLSVISSNGDRIGQVDSIIAAGGNDVIVVREGKKETLIPAIGSVILKIDIQAGIMRVNLPEGL